MKRAVLAIVCAAWASVGQAQPDSVTQPSFVTVNPEPKTHAWYLRAEFHALHREIRGIPVKRIRESWCKATEFTEQLLPEEALLQNGVDVMAAAGLSFSVEGHFDGSKTKQVALVGVFETCGGEKGPFILIIDAGTRKIRFLSAMPNKDQFSALAAKPDSSIRVMFCIDCDFSAKLKWNRKKKAFVWVDADTN